MSNTICLFCLVHGEPVRRAFPIDIDKNKSVGHLKELIKEKNPKALGDFDAKDLALWKVNIPDDDAAALRDFAAVEENELFASRGIEDYFDEWPPKRHIHIIIERRPASSDLAVANTTQQLKGLSLVASSSSTKTTISQDSIVVQQNTTTLSVRLFAAPLDNFPTNLRSFQRMFVNPTPVRPIPVDTGIFSPEALQALKDYIVENPAAWREHRRLGALFVQAYETIWRGGIESSQVSFWDKLVREPLELLSDCSDAIKLLTARNSSDSSDATEGSTRPDFLCWLEGVLVMLGEEKGGAEDFLAALDDLIKKTKPFVQGESSSPFLFAYAAGGWMMRFFIIERKTGVKPLTRTFDLKSGEDRVRVVAVAFQIFRCLQHFPSRLVPASRRIMQ